uniref:RING-type domain-containing protein n=1 Tax=Macrostomum lignano TaxID=282301 RepID=A0A1I8FSC7_9PLAT
GRRRRGRRRPDVPPANRGGRRDAGGDQEADEVGSGEAKCCFFRRRRRAGKKAQEQQQQRAAAGKSRADQHFACAARYCEIVGIEPGETLSSQYCEIVALSPLQYCEIVGIEPVRLSAPQYCEIVGIEPGWTLSSSTVRLSALSPGWDSQLPSCEIVALSRYCEIVGIEPGWTLSSQYCEIVGIEPGRQELEIPRFGRPPSQLLPAGGGAGPSSGLQSHAMLDFRRTRWRQRNLMSMTDDELRPFIGVSRLLPRAYDGIDNAAMGSIQLSLNDPSRSRRSGDFTDQQQPQQPQQLYADYRRRSLTADSDTTSLGRGRDGAKGTTPVGSYISGVLGGSLHPGLAADDLADDAEAADVQDEDAKSAADSASEAVVRLRAENARLAERLRSAEQRARQAERERLALAERALATAGELDEAREELREEQRLAAGLKRQLESERAARPDPSESPQSPPGSSLDAELERANRRAGSLERSLQEMQRRLLLAESRQVGADNEAAAAAASDDLEAAPSTSPMDPAAALAVGAMSQAVADLRADSEALRRRAARDELARKRRLEEVEEKAADGQRASEEALLSVSLGLESARAQNAELRQLLERSEAARRDREDFGQLQESQSGLEAWAAQVAAGREDLRQLGEANSELRARLDWLERGLDGLGAELRAARAEAARRSSERCRRLAEEAARARQAEEKSGRAARRRRRLSP